MKLIPTLDIMNALCNDDAYKVRQVIRDLLYRQDTLVNAEND